MKTIIYRREDQNTTPRGFGNAPTYHFDKPYSSGAEMIWVEPVEITLPENYEIAEAADGTKRLYNANGEHMEVIDFKGHPAIVAGVTSDHAVFQTLDK